MRAFSLLFCLGAAALVLPLGCGPDPEGVEDCRAIEGARCRAAAACGEIEDAARCERYYRDQCLHGLSVDSPGRPVVEGCVEAIEAAPDEDDCESVLEPERLSACSFLGESDEPAPDPGAGGEGGTPSSEPEAGAPGSEPEAGAGGASG